ncbi:hypothetical protein [Streptomyces zagrosensis]|uniref:Uncharacterized protein n=1 Tax=Streptomyces zagrosensis TaxID=1042984 RepID=A0A7W9QFE7_9ACTN|nr:hypothetical protein [Streptomyces zagrosensis]MBB5939260.1 hypothetical protein [Streptomyces zagrosensis]
MPDTAPVAPVTPHAAISACIYLRAVQADDIDAVSEFAGAEPRMPELLVRVTTRIGGLAPQPVGGPLPRRARLPFSAVGHQDG